MSGDRCFEAAKTIDELYDEVRDFDIVLCNDAPLATALNNRIDTARLGRFAVTPRQLASELSVELAGHPVTGDIPLVRRLSEYTGYGMRYVHGEVQNFKKAARYTSDIAPRLGRRSKNIYREYSRELTLDRLMVDFSDGIRAHLEGKRVAVIGLDLFDNLDKHVLPDDFEEVDPFKRGSDFSIREMHALGNDRQIADCAVDIVKRCGPLDVAIVLDTGGAIADAVKSVLYWNDIPFVNALEFKDINSVRNYLQFLQLSLSFDSVLVGDARQLLMTYGGFIAGRYDKYYFSRFCDTGISKSERLQELVDCMSSIRGRTFEEVRRVCHPSGGKGASVSMLLDQMGMRDAPVTREALDDLVYAVNSIGDLRHNEQIPPEEKRGVLLVDCKNSVYIDRPVVVYTGLTCDWEVDLGDLDYIDPKKRPDIEDVNAMRFKILIQQGSARFYLANATVNGEESVPCKYFDKCLRGDAYSWQEQSDPVASFAQIPVEALRTLPWPTQRKDRTSRAGGWSETVIGGAPPSPKMFSNSSYMNFVACPRLYMLSQLSDSEDKASTYTGTRIHDYAEFRVSYPEMARKDGVEFCADLIADECAPLSSPDLARVERSKILAAVTAIDAFVERTGVSPGEMIVHPDRREDNMFLVRHGLAGTSEHTEMVFSSKDDAMYGKIDLLWDGVIYDYKTGDPKTASEVSKGCDIAGMREGRKAKLSKKSCQPLFYLCLLEDCDIPNRRRFDLLFLQEMYRRAMQGEEPRLEECVRSIQLCESVEERYADHPTDIFEAARYKEHGWDPMEVYRVCRDTVGGDPGDWFSGREVVPQLEAAIASRFGMYGKKGALTKSAAETIGAGLRQLAKDISGYVASRGSVIVMREAIDEFRKGVLEDMARLKECYGTSFPAKPAIDCRDCYCRDMCAEEDLAEEDEDESE